MPTSQTQQDLRERNLLFLTTPTLWPDWPFLPLVRYKPEGMELGLLFDCGSRADKAHFKATVFLANLFMLPPTEEEFFALPREVYDTPQEIYAAGWRVD